MPLENLRWLQSEISSEGLSQGVSFGMPWPKGRYQSGQRFIIEGDGEAYPLDSREIAFWPDNSLKWTAHSVSQNIVYCRAYTVRGADRVDQNTLPFSDIILTRSGLEVKLPSSGSSILFENLAWQGSCICSSAEIVVSINGEKFTPITRDIIIENSTFSRIVIKISGVVVSGSAEHLPWDVRVYLYHDTSAITINHSFIHDLDGDQPLTSLGLCFRVPFGGAEPYNRHIFLGTSDGGILAEQVQGLSGLRHGPTLQNRIDQMEGRYVSLSENEWERTNLKEGLARVPTWQDYTLSQLSSNGYTIKKRTKAGCSWVKTTGGHRADGTAYVGSAANGGLAIGMAEFWERYPTQLDLTNLTKDEGEITAWLYSPLAEPLETAPYHDGLDMRSHEQQMEGLTVTYEDYEPRFGTANGIGRSNQLFLKPHLATPSKQEMSLFSSLVRNPPRLVPTVEYMYSTGVFYGCWDPDHRIMKRSPSQRELSIENNLEYLFNFYRLQVEQHDWYGFWDYGDVQHSYDSYRHAWRYDVGGYAWDNSELSTDLWLWLYYLHTGRADVFKMAQAMTQHTAEVDVYHAGRFKGFGTRHGVQHWSDSSKQLRISNVLYKRIYFYLSGDERIGDLIEELACCQDALLTLDSHRKVQKAPDIPKGFAMANIGLDCGPLAASWLTAWERRSEGWSDALGRLMQMLDGLTQLTHGIANNAILLNPKTGEVRECPSPTPRYAISHLSMLFGFPQIFTELLHDFKDHFEPIVSRFKVKVWLPYSKAYNGGRETQLREFGFEFPPDATWRQSHSTLTAIVAVEQESPEWSRNAWDQFFHTDGYSGSHEWRFIRCSPPDYFTKGEEAPWITTNEAAQYAISAIFNLANIRKHL